MPLAHGYGDGVAFLAKISLRAAGHVNPDLPVFHSQLVGPVVVQIQLADLGDGVALSVGGKEVRAKEAAQIDGAVFGDAAGVRTGGGTGEVLVAPALLAAVYIQTDQIAVIHEIILLLPLTHRVDPIQLT